MIILRVVSKNWMIYRLAMQMSTQDYLVNDVTCRIIMNVDFLRDRCVLSVNASVDGTSAWISRWQVVSH